MNIFYDIQNIYDNDMINIPELNLLNGIFNPYKTTKMLILVIPLSYMSVWIYVEARQYKSLILLYDECSSTILMIISMSKIKRTKDAVMHWQTKASNITTNNSLVKGKS